MLKVLKLSLSTKLIVAFIVVCVFGAIASSGTTAKLISSTIHKEAYKRVHHDLIYAKKVLESQLQRIKLVLGLDSRRSSLVEDLITGRRRPMTAELEGLRSKDGLDLLAVMDRAGQEIGRSSAAGLGELRLEVAAVLRKALSKRMVASTEVLSGGPPGSPLRKAMMLVGAVAITDGNQRPLGVLYGGVLLNGNRQILEAFGYKASLVEQKEGGGKPVAAIFLEDMAIVSNIPGMDQGRLRMKEHIKAAVLDREGLWLGKEKVQGRWYINAYAPIRDSEQKVIGALSVGTLESPYIALRNKVVITFVIVAFVGVVMILILSFYLAPWLFRPLNELVLATEKITRGDLTHEVPVRSKDEIGTLARSFNTMVRSLQEKEQELRRSSTFLRNVIQSSVDGIIVADMKGNVIIFNEGAENLLNYKAEEVIQKIHITEIYTPGTAREVMKKLRSKDYGGYGRLEKIETTLVNKQGEVIPVYVSAAIIAQAGQEIATVGIFTDLRERKKLEQQLIHSAKLSSLGVLAAGVAHELNQPLNVIKIGSDFFLKKIRRREEISREDMETVATEINTQVVRAAEIIDHLRAFGRKSEHKRYEMDVNEPIQTVFKMLGQQLKVRKIDVNLELSSNLPPIMADINRLEQVFINLVINARDSMEEKMAEEGPDSAKGLLRVSSFEEGGQVVVTFADNGKGIPEAYHEKVFEPFFTTKEVGKGTGLGLAIAYGIVKDYDGMIEFRSRPGEGATFTVRFPAYRPESASAG